MASVDQTSFRQDMPPKGGYAPIYVQRTFPKISSSTGRKVAAFVGALFVAGYFKYRAYNRARMRWAVENNDVRMVTTGFHLAERDRFWLNLLRQVRDEERELMKDVPGWRVGTFYGEPVYYTLPPDAWWDPASVEVLAHTSPYDHKRKAEWHINIDARGGPKWYDKYLPFWLKEI